MTRKNISTPDITAGSTDAERLLSLTPAGAASAERAVLPFRLTQLVVARFDMDVVACRVKDVRRSSCLPREPTRQTSPERAWRLPNIRMFGNIRLQRESGYQSAHAR
jgi:hypothetical protein